MEGATPHIWPNFLIVGAARCGTTSLHESLGRHPEIFMPLQKEPCFFAFCNTRPEFVNARHNYLTDTESYLHLFEGHTEKIRGESSTPYLYLHGQSIANIKALVPGAEEIKILIILRDPAERAFSQYMHNRRDLREPLSFREAVEAEAQRKKDNWHFDFFYVDKGFYYAQVKDYIEHFPQVKVCFYDDLERDPAGLLREICSFLGVDPDLAPAELKQRNRSGEMKMPALKRLMSDRKNPLLNFVRKLLSRNTKKRMRNALKSLLLKYNLKKMQMDPAMRKRLIGIYSEDIEKLSGLLQKDLSAWMKI